MIYDGYIWFHIIYDGDDDDDMWDKEDVQHWNLSAMQLQFQFNKIFQY